MGMKVPKYIRDKMHKVAELHHKAADISTEVDNWFVDHGFDIAELRCGDGYSLEELDYGNDVADIFCERIENGEFGSYGERRTDEV